MTSRRSVPLILALLCLVWCAGIVGAPLLRHTGAVTTSDILYEFYGRVCHQLDGHSWHADGLKFAVCVRCSSIYFSFTAGVVAWIIASRRRNLSVPKPAMLFAAGGIMLADVVLNLLGFHASTITTRAATGVLLGSVLPWIVVPLLVEAIDQIRRGRRSFSRPFKGEMQHV